MFRRTRASGDGPPVSRVRPAASPHTDAVLVGSPRLSARLRALSLAVLVLTVPLVAGCGGGDDDGGGPDGTTEETAPDPFALDEPDPGRGVAVIGVEQLAFEVTECSEEPGADDTEVAVRELLVAGEGETSDSPFTVEITRYRSDTGAGDPVLTETARITEVVDPATTIPESETSVPVELGGLEARRSTGGADGAWLDLADPSADGPLIAQTGDSVDVRATFGPDRARAGDEGLVEGRIRATCPG
jgi:hypothetical protein